ncbi:MAG TPA: AAA family ATPase [Pirellulales bacterium]|jgi:energy-coupling factor transporter ATP-binding protein EcfA2|nr:AAA family ATPase [Pirellulales bacterium]
MLTRVEIKKFKSCENLVLDGLGNITALVGRNGAGKTNILQAIDWTARASTQAGPIDTEPSLELNSTAIYLTLPEGRFVYRIEASIAQADDAAQWRIQESLDWVHPSGEVETAFRRSDESVVIGSSQTVQIGATVPTMTALLAILPADSPGLTRIRPVYAFLRAVRYFPLDEPVKVSEPGAVSEAEYKKWRLRFRASRNGGESVLYRLIHLNLEEPEKFSEVKSLLGGSGISLVDAISVTEVPVESPVIEQRRKYYVPGFRLSGGSGLFTWDGLSQGTRRIIRLLVSLVFDDSSVMLVEHPEDGIHRGLLRKLIGLLKTYSDPTQVILASHSGVVFNSLEPEETRLVSFESGKTALRSLTGQEVELAARFLEEEGTLEDFLETIQQED